MAPITGREVDARTEHILRLAYRGLVKAGKDSVRAAWRFGQAIDSCTDSYTQLQLAGALGVHPGTIAP